MAFQLRSLHIEKGYGASDPFVATLNIKRYNTINHSSDCKMELQLDEAMTLKIIELVAPHLVEAASMQISNFVQDAREVGTPLIEAAPAPEPKKPSIEEELDDDVPF